MAEITTLNPTTPGRKRLASLFNNPMAMKELRSRMRGRRAFALLSLYLLALGGVITLVYLTYTTSVGMPGSTAGYTAGKGLFAAVLSVQVVLVTFVGPILTAGAISGERDRQTFDLLRTTLLSADSLVLGKLVSALSYIFLLVLVSIPLQSIAFLVGGLSLVELALSQLLILVTAVTYAIYGLWCSATMRSTLAATVATLAGTLFITFGLPILAFMGVFVLGTTTTWGISGSANPVLEIIMIYAGLVAAAVNLPATLIVSEVFLLDRNTLFFTSQYVGGQNVVLFSPWLLFIILHVLVAVFFYRRTVRRVRRINDV
ncbi:MAG: hypothetical protein KBF17_12105 [Candidatus Promineofilum sp.]|nr:hypothetical protein [Promineifilum sp.]MBP9658029.1 hypothetical protein [Promineifilum sp.]